MSITSFFRDVFTDRPSSRQESETRKHYRDVIHDFRNQQFKSVGQARHALRVAETAESKLKETIKLQESSEAGLRHVEREYVRRLQGNT